MRKMIGIVSLCVCSAAAAGPVEEVRCREVGFSQAAERRDREAFASFIDEDARFVGRSVSRGRESIVEAWGVFFTDGGPEIKWRPGIVEVLEGGQLALTRGPYRLVTTDGEGAAQETWGTFNSVWRLNPDGQWRVVFDAGGEAAGRPEDAAASLLDQAFACPPVSDAGE